MDKYRNSNIVFFDGVCNLCSGFVQFILKNERDNNLYFASLQSTFAQDFLNNIYNEDISAINSLGIGDYQSIYFYQDGKLTSHSTAVLEIANYLKAPYRYLSMLSFIPSALRDFIYRIVAKNRYKFLGKKSTCWLPQPHLSARFLG